MLVVVAVGISMRFSHQAIGVLLACGRILDLFLQVTSTSLMQRMIY